MNRKISRICFFVFFDPQGIVDSYVIRLLDALRPSIDRLIVISNSPLEKQEQQKLESHSDQLLLRENRGMDAAAFKDGMVKFCGWNQLQNYDEVVLVNDTFFGPIHSFDDMFHQMAPRDLDFWGMSAGYRQVDGWKLCKYGYIPDHIQTFFVAFRKKMVCSQVFQDYWNSYDDSKTTFNEVVTGHEVVMTKYFEERGFRWDVYSQAQKYNSKYQEENFNIYFFRPLEMMQDMEFPIFKKKVLNANMPELLYMNDLEEAADAMSYIQNHTDYDINLIWDNVLRLYNVEDLYHSLHLNYILDSAPAEMTDNAAVVFHLTNPFFTSPYVKKAIELSEALPVYLIADSPEAAESVQELLGSHTSVHVMSGSGQDTEMGAFILNCKILAEKYAYLGFVHDLQNPDHLPVSVPESTVLGYLKNIANDSSYIANILNCFRENPRLGILGAPSPVHHSGFGKMGDGWDVYFAKVNQLAKRLNLNCKLSQDKQPLMTSGAFWCRTSAIRPLWQQDWQTGDFKRSPLSLESSSNEALKRLLPYAAQSSGFYSGICMHTDYASMRITDQEIMLQDIISLSRKQLGITSDNFIGYRRQLESYSTGKAGSNVNVNLSELGLSFLIKYVLLRRLPKKLNKLFQNTLTRIRRIKSEHGVR